ncbi:DedA family protein [Nocardia sp. CA-129566]|uniref:DedA family protein n=1 Tax=Nocardia sp. CA-129566 TaxID=3239976 RepID=UPI003D975849
MMEPPLWHRIMNLVGFEADMPAAGPPRSRTILLMQLSAIASLAAAGLAATAFFPVLLRDDPHLLITLDAKSRYLFLARPRLGLLSLAAIGFARRLAGHYLYFSFARRNGPAAVVWIKRRSRRSARAVETVERYYARIGVPAVFVSSGNTASLLAGACGMRLRVFLPVSIAGTIAQITAIAVLAHKTRARSSWLVDAIDANAGRLTTALVVVLIVWFLATGLWASVRRESNGHTADDPPQLDESAHDSPDDRGESDAGHPQ